MGLDIYLYKVSKNKFLKENEKYTREELEKLTSLTYFPIAEACETIKKNSTKITVTEKEFSPKLIGEYFKINNVEEIHLMSCDVNKQKYTFSLYDEDKKRIGEVTVKDEDIENVIIDKDYEYLAFDIKEIDYQRKGLNDYGWELLPENCSFSDDFENVKKMCKKGGLSNTFVENWIPDHTVLHPWW